MEAINIELNNLRAQLIQERAKWHQATQRLRATLTLQEMQVISQECRGHESEVERLEELLRTAEKTANAMQKSAMVQNGSLAAAQGASYYSPYQDNSYTNPILASQNLGRATEAGAFGMGVTQIFTDSFNNAMDNNNCSSQSSANSGYAPYSSTSSYSQPSQVMPYADSLGSSAANTNTSSYYSPYGNNSGPSGFSNYGSTGSFSSSDNSSGRTYSTRPAAVPQPYNSSNSNNAAANYADQQSARINSYTSQITSSVAGYGQSNQGQPETSNFVYPFGSLKGYSVSNAPPQASQTNSGERLDSGNWRRAYDRNLRVQDCSGDHTHGKIGKIVTSIQRNYIEYFVIRFGPGDQREVAIADLDAKPFYIIK